MADINVQRRSRMTWLWVLLGLIILALILWTLAANEEERVTMAPGAEQRVTPLTGVQPTTPAAPAPEATSATSPIPVSQITQSPATWSGRTISGMAHVVNVPTDRGFWIEAQGERLFVILIEHAAGQPSGIGPGQTLRFDQATLHDPSYLVHLPGRRLDADTQAIVEGLPVFLVADEANITVEEQS